MNNKFIAVITSLILLVIALLTSKWSTSDGIGSNKLSFGLWKNCVDNKCGNINRIYNNDFPKSVLEVCRGLVIISILILIYTGIVLLSKQKFNINLIFVAGIISLLSSLLWFIEFRKITISGSGSIPPTIVNYNLGYSFYLNLFSGLICVLYFIFQKYF